jgi:DNA-binding HxlR family transcriptional regulator
MVANLHHQLSKSKYVLHIGKERRYTEAMSKRYDQYCPIAKALELVGERWSLLVVRELINGPKRYTDLAEQLPGIGTNILASRLKDLEGCGVVVKRKLPPPAASQVYELTPYGTRLKAVMRELAAWGIQSLGPPQEEDLSPGWLVGALDTFFAPVAPRGNFEFRIGGEVASLVDCEARIGPLDDPDVVIEADPAAFYFLFVERRRDGVSVDGDEELFEQLVEAAAVQPATADAVA